MPGNSIGKLFVVTSFGESHGPAIGCVVDAVRRNSRCRSRTSSLTWIDASRYSSDKLKENNGDTVR